MDTRTRTASPIADEQAEHATPPPVQDKISAYYSLVFPHYTFYIQTLSITIGRRCATSAASSSSEPPQVDVDLGALKSVSRLHAKIEYDQEEDRFVLAVIGRNGAWVDGVWTCAGSRAPLGERSQIQIASRTFHFVLPPPPPPEDSPSPSSQSSANRPRSPSVDITSISPPSSQLSHSPPPTTVKLPPPASPPLPPTSAKGKGKTHPKPAPPPEPELPNTNSIGKSNKTNPKKRKKSDVDPPPIPERPKPEDMPPKPTFTYAQLIYRAIKDMNGKATLQEICNWIMTNYEYYRYADGAWTSSVRHNLSSSRAFLKMERCGGDRGKGFFWSIDEQHSKSLEEHEQKSQEAAAAAAAGIPFNPQEGHVKGRKKDKASALEPALRRSIKGDLKGTPLPPPLTSAPLAFKNAATPDTSTSTSANSSTPTLSNPRGATSAAGTMGVFAYPSHTSPPSNPSYPVASTSPPAVYPALTQPRWPTHPVSNPQIASASTSTPPPGQPSLAGTASTSTGPIPTPAPAQLPNTQPTPGQPGVPDVVVPISLGPIPHGHPDYAPGRPNNSAKEGYMILHERKLILDPTVFSELTQEMLAELEKMGARAALGVLAGHMVRALKERRARERSKGIRRPKGAAGPGAGRGGAPKKGPFTKVPLDESRKLGGGDTLFGEGKPNSDTSVQVLSPPTIGSTPNTETLIVSSASTLGPPLADPGSPIIVVDDEDEDEPTAKRRKLEEKT